MVVDAHGMSHKPKGLPQGEAGTYENRGARYGDLDLDPMLTLASMGARNHAIVEHVSVKPAAETRALLAQTARVEIGANGATLYDGDGNIVFREDPAAPPLDWRTMRNDPHVRLAARRALRDPLDDMSAADRRATVRAAFRFAGAYDRRNAIDSGPNRRYIPATHLAASLRRRRDREKAARLLVDLHYEDANTAAAIIRLGYPNDSHSAWVYINATKIKRQPRDVVDRRTGRIIARKGDPIVGDWTDKDGNVKHGPLPESRGAMSRAYLRMMYQPTNGVPSGRQAKDMADALRAIGEDGPRVQAQAFWELCYGNGGASNLRGDVDFAKRLVARRSETKQRGVRLLERFSRGRGQGNAARMVAYQKPLSREAAIAFIAMEPGDARRAHTGFTRRRRNPSTGLMEDVKPKRLNEMRAWMHAVYEIRDSEVKEWRDRHPDG